MSLWSRLRQTFQRNRHRLNAGVSGTRSEQAVEIAMFSIIPMVFSDWGTRITQDSATFKELHQPRSIYYSTDDKSSGG